MKKKADRWLCTLGVIVMLVGLSMCWEGAAHIRSGEPIAATRYTKASNGPETLIFGLIGVGLGGYLLRRGLQGRSFF